MPLERSPYYIRNTAVKPPALPGKPNWLQSLIHWWKVRTPNADMRVALAYEKTANTGQIRPIGGEYQTKQAAAWAGGVTSGDVLPIFRPSTDIRMPWPVATPTGQPANQRIGRDFAIVGPEAARGRTIAPRPAPYLQTHSSNDRQRRDLIPIGGGRKEHGLDYGESPWRVPLNRKSGLSLSAGIAAFGMQQWFAGVGGTLPVSPPVWQDYTRGTRGASGILSRVQGPGRARVPATFTPSEVR
jgi:hypothetical protein